MLSIPLPFAVFFTFLGLKLSGDIAWSWWWVFAPLWIAGFFTVVAFLCWVALYLTVRAQYRG